MFQENGTWEVQGNYLGFIGYILLMFETLQ